MLTDDRAQKVDGSRPGWNLITGQVVSILHGLTRATMKVTTEDHTIFRARCPSELFERASVRIGEQVTAQIPADAVLLGTAGVWPGKDRWNRWTGRIVLVEPGLSAGAITVKLYGKSWTLTSTGPIIGQPLRPQAWDPVNIVIDPERISLVPQQAVHASQHNWTAARAHAVGTHRVWLPARVEAVRTGEGGCIVSLDVGGAHVSAHISGDPETTCAWIPGLPVEIHVGQWEAWLKPKGGSDTVFCRLVY